MHAFFLTLHLNSSIEHSDTQILEISNSSLLDMRLVDVVNAFVKPEDCKIKLRETLNEIRKNQYWHYIAWSKFGLALCLFRLGDVFNGKILINEIKDIYFDLSERVDSAYIEDYRFIDGFDYYDNDAFLWYGNHAHFSNPLCLIRTKNSRRT